MQEIPVFDEFGFSPSTHFKVPLWAWAIIAIIIGGIISFFIFKPKEKKVIEDKKGIPPSKSLVTVSV